MPPGMTMCPPASITRPAVSAGSAPGAAMAAMVSPAMATSAAMTPWGVTTWPLRMMVSSMVPPEEWTERRIDTMYPVGLYAAYTSPSVPRASIH